MELKLPTPEQFRLAYQRDLRQSFPAAEMKTLTFIRGLWEKERYLPYCFFDGEEIAGEAFVWLGQPGWAMLDYLCVVPSRRSSGLGQELLRALQETLPKGTVLLGEAEDPDYAPDCELARRRLGFYHRAGWRLAGYHSQVFGARYLCIYQAEGKPDMLELMQQQREIYRASLPPRQFRRFVHIPWDPLRPSEPL